MANDSYCVLARRDVDVRPAVARAVAQATGQVALDVTRNLRETPGILADNLPQHQAERLVGALSQVDVSAFSLPRSELVQFPEPVFLETARLGDDILVVEDLRAASGARLGTLRVPYKDIVFAAAGQVSEEKRRRVNDSTPYAGAPGVSAGLMIGGPLMAAAMAADGATPASHMETSVRDHHVLDLFAVNPAHHIRLNAKTFNFTQTGLPLQMSSLLNLTEFIKRLGPLCESAAIDLSVKHILDGDPLTNLRFKSLERYEAYVFWRVQLLYHPNA